MEFRVWMLVALVLGAIAAVVAAFASSFVAMKPACPSVASVASMRAALAPAIAAANNQAVPCVWDPSKNSGQGMIGVALIAGTEFCIPTQYLRMDLSTPLPQGGFAVTVASTPSSVCSATFNSDPNDPARPNGVIANMMEGDGEYGPSCQGLAQNLELTQIPGTNQYYISSFA